MSTAPALDLIRDALRNTMVEKWAAKIATVNALRVVSIRAANSGPYVVTNGMTMTVEIDGASFIVTPTEGSRTAAQMVTEFDAAITGLGCVDDSETFVLQHATAPSGTTDRKLEITEDVSDLAALMGFTIGDVEHRAPLLPLPRPHFYDFIPPVYDKQPRIVIEDLAMEGPENLKARSLLWASVELVLEAHYSGGSYQPTYDLMLGYARAFREIILENNHLGTGDSSTGGIVTTKIDQMQAQPRLYQETDKSPVNGEIPVTIRCRVWNA